MANDCLQDGSTKTEQNGIELHTQPSHQDGDVVHVSGPDTALLAKTELLSQAIDRIGFTNYHTKLFFLNGFGYAADSMLTFLPSITASNVLNEYNPTYTRAGQLSLYVGLLAGALFWGITADIIGRKWAFNITLLITACFAIVAGGAPNYVSWASFNALSAFGAGGNLVLDTTVFLEYLPRSKTWVITLMATWWGVGITIAGLVAWGFLPNFSCVDLSEACTRQANMGWRYVYFTSGGLILVMSMLRITIIRFHETPHFLLCQSQDDRVVDLPGQIARKYGRPFNLTVADLQDCGQLTIAHAKSKLSFSQIFIHYKGLSSSRHLRLSTSLLWLSWTLIGLAYPLFYIFLPDYLSSRGAELGESSAYTTWRNYAITNACGVPGPVIAGFMTNTHILGRKYTMVTGGLISMAFLFAYTSARTNEQNFGFSCATSVAINIYYGTLYAYTPEALPSAHRATGNGTSVALNRLMGIIAVIFATFADTATSVPTYLCAASFGMLSVVASWAGLVVDEEDKIQQLFLLLPYLNVDRTSLSGSNPVTMTSTVELNVRACDCVNEVRTPSPSISMPGSNGVPTA